MKNEVTVKEDKFRIILYQEKSEHDSTTIDVCTSKNGSLTVGGYDLGPLVKGLMGRSDYEYDATVDAEDKYALYIALRKELFDSHDDFRTWVTYNDVVDVEADFNVVLLLMVKKLGLYPHDFENWAKEHDIDVHFWSS
jgi:hypothetical protein